MSQPQEKDPNATRLDDDSQTSTNSTLRHIDDEEKASPTDQTSSPAEPVQIPPNKVPYNPWADPSSFPDGGLRAWMTVAGCAACFFVSWGWINCIGLFQDYYHREQLSQYSESTIAWIPSLETFFMLFCGPIAGKIFDDHGPTNLLIFGTFMHVFGLMMASISKEYYQFLLSQGVCSAIGASCVFTAAVSSLPSWFFKKRGMAIGIAAAGSSLGGVIFPVIVSRMLRQTTFGWTMRTCAFLILALCLFGIATVRVRIAPVKRPFEFMAFVRPLTEVPMMLLTIAVFFFYFGMFPIFSFVTVVANGRGMSLELSQYLVSILNAGSVFGRTLPGILGDKIGRFNVMNIFCYLTVIFVLGLYIPADTNAGQLVFAPLFGFSSGAAIGLTPALIAQISPLREIGIRTGTIFAIGSVGALTGAPIGGALIARDNGGFLYLQLFAGLTCLVGCIILSATRINVGGWSIKKKV
ncbi:hypothetical protein PV10_00916 [Exophiala mesophila]|uniref:Major facilitator superfamily (MFS) profile domain-containing protein n=1 Tax=Exophiala mesophila TaxID=212818 RepID=A0A0D2AE18_EXOME|nr:uncharacterized protein PV10_00916 [Exophiala mesophila]KIV97128.1 hypothetical protein PV10_00916 [Exophiala mesophila]